VKVKVEKQLRLKRAVNENILEAVNNKKQFTIRKNVGNAVGATSSDGYLVVFAAVTARTKDRDQSSRKGQAGMYEQNRERTKQGISPAAAIRYDTIRDAI